MITADDLHRLCSNGAVRSKMNKCHLCDGEKTNGFTTYAEDVNDRCIVVRHVPCDKCMQCGEETISLDVAKELEAIAAEFHVASRTEVAIVSYGMEKAA